MFWAVRTQQQPGFHDTHQISRRLALRRGEKGPESARSAAGMESGRPLSGDGRARGQARPRPRRDRMHRVREGLQGPARRHRGQPRRRPHARRGGAALRGDRGRARPADFLCRAALRRQHHRSRHRQVLRRHAGAHHRGLAASVVLHARTEPARRRGARQGDGRSRARPLPALDRGHPQGQAVPARGPRRATVPREVGDRLFRLQPAVRRDHGGAALQGRRQVAAARADAQHACRTPTRRSARPRPRRWPRPSRRTCGSSR